MTLVCVCSTDGISLYNSSKVAVCMWPVINEFTKEYNISSQSSKFDISVGKKKTVEWRLEIKLEEWRLEIQATQAILIN